MKGMTEYLMDFQDLHTFCSPLAVSKRKDAKQTVGAQENVTLENGSASMDLNDLHNFVNQNTFSEDDVTSHTAKSKDVPIKSLESSLYLTEAQHTTSRPTSSTRSGTSAFQGSIKALAPLCSNGMQANSSFSGVDVGGCIPDPHFDPFSFPSRDNNVVDTRVPLTPLRNEATSKISSNYDGDDVNSRFHGKLCNGEGVFLGSRATSLDDIGKGIGSCQEGPRTLQALSDIPSETMESFIKEKSNCMNSDNDKEKVISVVDPQRSKLHVSLSAISPTRALGARVQNPSLCLLFQSGRCRQGANCHQVHVDPNVVQRLRQIVDSFPSCCTFHGDCNSKLWNAEENVGRSIVVGNVVIPLSRVAFTSGLTRFVANAMQRPLSPDVLCRLHGKPSRCRYGGECWYLHVCREILEKNFAFVIESDVANTLGECSVKTSSQVTCQKPLVILGGQKEPQHLQLKEQLNTAGPQSQLVTTNHFPMKNNNNNNNGNGSDHRDQAIFYAVPCMLMHPGPHMQKLESTSAGVLNGDLVSNKLACNTLTQGFVPMSCSVPQDHAMSFAPGPFTNQNPCLVSVGHTNVEPHPMPTFPPYYMMKGIPAPSATTIGVNPSLPGAYPSMWLPQQQQQLHQQQSQQACLPPQNWNMARVPTLAVFSAY